VIIQRTVKEIGASVQYPMLTRSNYTEWAMMMQVNMEAQGIWYAIKPEEDEAVEYCDDHQAMAAILRSVPTEMLSSLRSKKTAQAAWDAIKTLCVGDERVWESTAQQLHREFPRCLGRTARPWRISPFASTGSPTTSASLEMTSRRRWW